MELFMRYPHDVQDELLQGLIKKAKDTEWGLKYDYRSTNNVETFQERVPISSYEDLFPLIDRMMKGESDVLWPGHIDWYAKSSGTTNAKSKFIPVSEDALEDCHFRGGKDMLSLYVNNYPNENLFKGKGLLIGGTHQPNPQNPKTFYGDLSAVIMENMPFWMHLLRVPSMKTALLEEWETKIERMILETESENVTSITGVPTWTLVLIQRILKKHHKDNLLDIWPNLELYIHGAVSFDPYRALFHKLIPSDQMSYLETYNASEGFFGIQDQPDSNDMLLMLDYGIYYEFIPIDELSKEKPKALTLSEVELDTNYAIIMTTNAGLWRYKIGDTIRFTCLNPYRIRISGRTKHFINAFGEEVIVENADEAIRYACEKTNSVLNNYTAAPRYMSENESFGGHEWLIEFEIAPKDIEHFSYHLDKRLKEVNSDYDAKRYKDLALKQPVVTILEKGTFYEWMRQKGKLGGQNKVPRLCNDRKHVDSILEMIGVLR